MDEKTLNLARTILYFNGLIENKEEVYKIFSETWKRITPKDQKTIIQNLELIIVGPYEDFWYPGTPAVTNESPVMPGKNRINWNSNFSDENSEVLLHELGHVLFNHPKEGQGKSGDDRKCHQLKAEMEVNKWMEKINKRELKRVTNQ